MRDGATSPVQSKLAGPPKFMLFSCDEYAAHEQEGDNCESTRSIDSNQTKDDAQVCKRASDSADKRQMQTMVRALLSMNVVPEPSDAGDALAVALCHLQAEKVRRRFGLPAKNALPKPRAPRKASGSSNTMATIQIGSATRTRLPRILSTR